jgi:hypothetical protein
LKRYQVKVRSVKGVGKVDRDLRCSSNNATEQKNSGKEAPEESGQRHEHQRHDVAQIVI